MGSNLDVLMRDKKVDTYTFRSSGYLQGVLKNAASGRRRAKAAMATARVSCLRRSGYAQAGLDFVVLTYCVYAARANTPVALLDGLFEHSL